MHYIYLCPFKSPIWRWVLTEKISIKVQVIILTIPLYHDGCTGTQTEVVLRSDQWWRVLAASCYLSGLFCLFSEWCSHVPAKFNQMGTVCPQLNESAWVQTPPNIRRLLQNNAGAAEKLKKSSKVRKPTSVGWHAVAITKITKTENQDQN